MEYTNNKCSISLASDEQILYVPNKDKEEFWVNITWSTVLFLFFIWLGFQVPKYIIPSAVISTELILLIISSAFLGEIYTYIRDYWFSQVILTSKRLIIMRFNKMISVDYNEIKKIYYRDFGYHPTFFLIELISNRVYKVNFVPRFQFKEQFEEINFDIRYKNEIFVSSEIINTFFLYLTRNNQKYTRQYNIEESADCWIIQPKRKYMLKPIFLFLLVTTFLYFCYRVAPPYDYRKFIVLAFAFVFGFLAISTLIKFITLKPYLIIKSEGLYYQGIFIPWENVNDFSQNPIYHKSPIILINLNNFDEVIKQFNPIKRRIVMHNKKTLGDVLLVSLLGTNLQKLDVLNRLKKHLDNARISRFS